MPLENIDTQGIIPKSSHSVFTILLSLGREIEMEKMLRNHILFSIL